MLKSFYWIQNQMRIRLNRWQKSVASDLKLPLTEPLKRSPERLLQNLKKKNWKSLPITTINLIPAYQVSLVINSVYKKNFFDFKNEHRVEYAKELLLNKSYNSITAFDSSTPEKAEVGISPHLF